MTMMEVVRIRRVRLARGYAVPETVGPDAWAERILLKVKAASINPVDWKIREGRYPAVQSDELPYVLGRDVSGVVEACGTEIIRHRKNGSLWALMIAVLMFLYDFYGAG
jgi:NADPH:quinone reductase-like Zn-dependent oxidoreductase